VGDLSQDRRDNVKSSLRTRSSRALAVGAISVALLTSGVATAFAVNPVAPNASPSASMTKKQDTPNAAVAAAIDVRADRTEVKHGQVVTFTGSTKGLPVGSTVMLQRHNGTAWVNLPDHTLVKKGDTYVLIAKLDTTGKQMYRVSDGKAVSEAVTITVQ
jgi:hypothetical protein